MTTWQKPPEGPETGPHPHHQPPPAHFWHGKPPHEHLYDACEAILANQHELSDRLTAIEHQLGHTAA